MSKIALVAGGTGLVGSCLLRRLLDDPRYAKVKLLSRRAPDLQHAKLELLLADLANLSGVDLAADDVYCCLGTTLRQAGSKAAFERVDYHMVVDLARAAKKAGAQQFLVVSSLGASTRSPAFYSRVKGRMEQAVSEAGFATVQILRPSLLLGARAQQRPAEDLAQRAAPLLRLLLRGPLAAYRPITADQVAAEMQRLAALEQLGTHVHVLKAD